MRWFPVAFLTNGVLKEEHGGIELTTPLLRVPVLNHYASTALFFQMILFGELREDTRLSFYLRFSSYWFYLSEIFSVTGSFLQGSRALKDIPHNCVEKAMRST